MTNKTVTEKMTQDDLDAIAETGERLPVSMTFDPSLLGEKDEMVLPVFNGEKVVDQAGE